MEERFLKPTVLVADDDAQIREILCSFLEDEGYRVLLAKDGREALRKARHDIEVILLDIEMPGVDGLNVCQALQKDPRTADIPVLFLTGWSEELARQSAFKAGATDFLDKPVRMGELFVRLAALTGMGKGTLTTERRTEYGQAMDRAREQFAAEEFAGQQAWLAP